MNRTAGLMVLCVVLGAAVMYGSSNFRFRVEPVGGPEVKSPPVAVSQENAPGVLPPTITNPQRDAQPRFDPNVRQVADDKGVPDDVVVQTVEDGNVKWAPSPNALALASKTVAFRLNNKRTAKLYFTANESNTTDTTKRLPIDGTKGVSRADPDTTTITCDLTKMTPDSKGVVTFRIWARSADDSAFSANFTTVTIRAPSAPPGAQGVQNVIGSNSPHRRPDALSDPTSIYSRDGIAPFLRLSGQKDTTATLKFVLQPDDANAPAFEVPTEDGVKATGLNWDTSLSLIQRLDNSTATLFVRAVDSDGRIYSEKTIKIKFLTIPSLDAPRIARPDNIPAGALAPTSEPNFPTYYTNAKTFAVVATAPDNVDVLVHYVDDSPIKLVGNTGFAGVAPDQNKAVSFAVGEFGDGDHVVRVAGVRGRYIGPDAKIKLNVRTQPPVIEAVTPATGFGLTKGATDKIVIRFNIKNPIDLATLNPTEVAKANFGIVHIENPARSANEIKIGSALLDPLKNEVTLSVIGILPGTYTVAVLKGAALRDVFGNSLGQSAVVSTANLAEFQITTQPVGNTGDTTANNVGTIPASITPAKPVAYKEYLDPREFTDGFNPSDRVESRVVRLYYYRDAARVAQLVNRSVKAYNAIAVDKAKIAADRGRDDADKATDDRQKLEYAAVKAAQEARAAESDLASAQSKYATNRTELDIAKQTRAARQAQLNAPLQPGQTVNPQAQQLQDEINRLGGVITSLEAIDKQGPADITRLQGAVIAKRDTEGKAVEQWQVKQLEERRAREKQFRVEVANAATDPDIFAAGDPKSVDPVLQVSVAMIGEGLIQLRGPIKGLNVIRTMVNQIDAPVGQVRVSVHTLQVNGERADRMEKVVFDIQRYLDHSRFLTAQSSQMLKRAITLVAARRAAEAQATLPITSGQALRDQMYLYSFFGKDFTDELLQLDSEFLKTGNKLLSLNSMDSTSLSAGLFVLALAKNDVRTEIFSVFLDFVQRELPQAEWNYYQAGFSDIKWKGCGACKDKCQYLLAYNSKFQSFIGFFTSEANAPDTLTPLQREFIRLAQIFKARLITEVQLKQRVTERALLEDRFGNSYKQMLIDARDAENAAKKELAKFQDNLQAAITESNKGLVELRLLLGETDEDIRTGAEIISELDKILVANVKTGGNPQPAQIKIRKDLLNLKSNPVIGEVVGPPDPNDPLKGKSINLRKEYPAVLTLLYNAGDYLALFQYLGAGNEEVHKRVQSTIATIKTTPTSVPLTTINNLKADIKELSALITANVAEANGQLAEIVKLLTQDKPDPVSAVARYNLLRDDLKSKVTPGRTLATTATRVFNESDPSFRQLAIAGVQYPVADKKARSLRRPLDEKKLMDMMVDDLEDKFIEILEGTRSHTSNIDNYMKTVATALDDDFNTQYYLPSFRRAREASRSWDVTLAQIETTSVLANNRTFAKVSPAASFEFDLPKRQILLTEGFKAAKALVDEYGALVNDPSFLALAKMASGNPVSMMQNGGGGMSAVRNVLPGLPGSTDERIMTQAGPGRREFGSALEALIPDPAIYKFETGTGFEIRPVLSPDGQAVVFGFDYMYTTDVREPVRADEKHLGRVKRHFVHTDVQLSNFELREVSKYMVSIKVARTGKGVQLLQDIPGVGVLFRPLPSAAASLQQNLIYSQATIFPTLFDLMGLRYAPAVADLDPLGDQMAEFAARWRQVDVQQRVGDIATTRVDDALRTPYGERRYDLYRPQVAIPFRHPNGYIGPGLRLKDGKLIEGYDLSDAYPPSQYYPGVAPDTRHHPYPLMNPYPRFDPLPQPREYVPPGTSYQRPPTQPGLSGTYPRVAPPTGAMLQDPRVPINYGKPVPITPPPPVAGANVPRPLELPATNFPPVVAPGIPPLTPTPALPSLPGAPVESGAPFRPLPPNQK